MAYLHDDDRRSHRSRDAGDEERERERVRGTGGYDPYEDRRRGPGGYGGYGGYGGSRWAEEYGGRCSGRDDEDGWQRDRERAASSRDDGDRERYGRGPVRSGSRGAGWCGTRDYDRFAASGRYGSESMGGTPLEDRGPGATGMAGTSMAGKGPKGYKRSDERIREDVCDCLTDDRHVDASGIEVKVKAAR